MKQLSDAMLKYNAINIVHLMQMGITVRHPKARAYFRQLWTDSVMACPCCGQIPSPSTKSRNNYSGEAILGTIAMVGLDCECALGMELRYRVGEQCTHVDAWLAVWAKWNKRTPKPPVDN